MNVGSVKVEDVLRCDSQLMLDLRQISKLVLKFQAIHRDFI
jgi:hypothetical protein